MSTCRSLLHARTRTHIGASAAASALAATPWLILVVVVLVMSGRASALTTYRFEGELSYIDPPPAGQTMPTELSEGVPFATSFTVDEDQVGSQNPNRFDSRWYSVVFHDFVLAGEALDSVATSLDTGQNNPLAIETVEPRTGGGGFSYLYTATAGLLNTTTRVGGAALLTTNLRVSSSLGSVPTPSATLETTGGLVHVIMGFTFEPYTDAGLITEEIESFRVDAVGQLRIVPEPGTAVLLGLGLVALCRRRASHMD